MNYGRNFNRNNYNNNYYNNNNYINNNNYNNYNNRNVSRRGNYRQFNQRKRNNYYNNNNYRNNNNYFDNKRKYNRPGTVINFININKRPIIVKPHNSEPYVFFKGNNRVRVRYYN